MEEAKNFKREFSNLRLMMTRMSNRLSEKTGFDPSQVTPPPPSTHLSYQNNPPSSPSSLNHPPTHFFLKKQGKDAVIDESALQELDMKNLAMMSQNRYALPPTHPPPFLSSKAKQSSIHTLFPSSFVHPPTLPYIDKPAASWKSKHGAVGGTTTAPARKALVGEEEEEEEAVAVARRRRSDKGGRGVEGGGEEVEGWVGGWGGETKETQENQSLYGKRIASICCCCLINALSLWRGGGRRRKRKRYTHSHMGRDFTFRAICVSSRTTQRELQQLTRKARPCRGPLGCRHGRVCLWALRPHSLCLCVGFVSVQRMWVGGRREAGASNQWLCAAPPPPQTPLVAHENVGECAWGGPKDTRVATHIRPASL